jgi:N-acetyl-1-D-myo-inositol-2-amino-2-deoxy-alpha-D-glucopyranoside deacetylase
VTLRLLLVHAHPDDETLTHGATIAAAVAHGHTVDLVTCTRGEEGEVIGEGEQHRTSSRDDTLGRLREAELAAALDALAAGSPGRVRHRYLDALPAAPGTDRAWPRYRDSGMVVLPGGRAGVPPDVRPECFAVAGLDEAAARLAGLVVGRRPHVLLTYGPHGGYGHPDHVMAHRVALRAPRARRPRLVRAVGVRGGR